MGTPVVASRSTVRLVAELDEHAPGDRIARADVAMVQIELVDHRPVGLDDASAGAGEVVRTQDARVAALADEDVAVRRGRQETRADQAGGA